MLMVLLLFDAHEQRASFEILKQYWGSRAVYSIQVNQID